MGALGMHLNTSTVRPKSDLRAQTEMNDVENRIFVLPV